MYGRPTPSTHGGASCLLHWRQLRQHVVGSQQVFFGEMPNSNSFDDFSERLQIVLFTLGDPVLNAVYNTTVDVLHVPRVLDGQGVGVPECESRGGSCASRRTLSRDSDVVRSPPTRVDEGTQTATSSPTLEESYRRATTQGPIIERGLTQIFRAGIPKRPLPDCQAGPTASSTPLFSKPRCRGVGTPSWACPLAT